jgi:hypothetical protein
MKKIFLSVAVLTLGVSGFVAAQTSPSIADLLKDATFGYNEQNVLAVDTIDATAIHLRSPIIKYLNGDAIYTYRLTYSPYPIEDLANVTDPAILDQIKSKEVSPTSEEDRVTLDLGIEDGLDPNTSYYAMVTPIDLYDEYGTSSEQVCFNLSQQRNDIGDNCLFFDKTPEEEHGSAVLSGEVPETDHNAASAVDLALANITDTISGNVITFQWTAVNGVDSMDIFVFNPSDAMYNRVGEVKMSAERYEYTMKWDGEHIFRFQPLNGGKEIIYNVNAMRSETKEPEKPITPPATGPVENTLLLLVLSGLIYLGYKRFKTQDSRC